MAVWLRRRIEINALDFIAKLWSAYQFHDLFVQIESGVDILPQNKNPKKFEENNLKFVS